MFKKTSLIVLTLAVIGLAALPAQAQAQSTSTNTVPTEGSFLNSTFEYFTSFNTNLDTTFGNHRGNFFSGVDSIQGAGVNLANSIGLSYDVLAPTNSSMRLSLESVTRDSGVAGTILSEQVGVGASVIVHDARLTIYADGGYWLYSVPDRWFAEIGIRASKALTTHTYAWVGVAAQIPANRQIFSAGVGIVF